LVLAPRRGGLAFTLVAEREIEKRAERGIEANLASPSERALVASRPDDPGRFFEDFCNWQRIPEIGELVRGSAAAGLAGLLTGSETVRFYHDHTLVKEPGTQQGTPWHQDQPYCNVDGVQTCSVWLPVDPVSRAATLEFVAGSHLGPWLMPRTLMESGAKWFPEGSLADLPDIEADRDAYDIVGWELEPGDPVFLNMLTLHWAAGSKAGTVAACCRCVSSATTSRMRRGPGRRLPSSLALPTSCRRVRRSTTRCSLLSGRVSLATCQLTTASA